MRLDGGLAASGTVMNFLGSTSNMLVWNTQGVAAPTTTTRSPGTKLVFYPGISATNVDYALGMEGSTLWQSVPTLGNTFKWYGGTGTMMSLSNNQLNMTTSGSRLAISGVDSYGSIGRSPQSTTTWDIYRVPVDAGYVHRYGMSTTLNRTENIDLTAGGTIRTWGSNIGVSYNQPVLHELGTIDVRGQQISTTLNVTKSGASINGFGISNDLANTNWHYNNLYGYTSAVYSNSSELTNQGEIRGINQYVYNNGDGYVPTLRGWYMRIYNNSNTGTVTNIRWLSIDTIIGIGKGAVSSNIGLDIAVNNAASTQRAISYDSHLTDPARNPWTIDGIYGTSYMANPTGTISLVRSNYGLAFVSTGTAINTISADYESRDGIGSNIAVRWYARQANTQTGTSLQWGQFYTDLNGGTAASKYVTNAYGIYGFTRNTATAAFGTIQNQYGAYLSASASANSTNAYGLYADANGAWANNYGLYLNASNATATGADGRANNYGLYVANSSKNYINSRLGIGTTTPWDALDVRGISYTGSQSGGIQIGTTNGYWLSWFRIKSTSGWTPRTAIDATDGGNTGWSIEAISISNAGNVGIGTTTPATKLQVTGDIRVGTSGTNGCIQGFGGATIAGTCSSDELLKTDILWLGTVLDRFLGIDVINYKWNQKAADIYKNDTSTTQIGYRAQNIESLFPELVSTNAEGYKQVNYSAMNIYAVKAIKELATTYNSLSGSLSSQSLALSQMQSLVASLSGSISTLSVNSGTTSPVINNTTTVVNNYTSSGLTLQMTGTGTQATQTLTTLQTEAPRSALAYITDQIAHLFDIVSDFVTLQITAVRGYFDQIWAKSIVSEKVTTDQICLKKSDGTTICINGDQLQSMMNNTSPSSSTPATPSTLPPASTETQAPVAETQAPVVDTSSPVAESPPAN
jgi:Chaperone of endosialidase